MVLIVNQIIINMEEIWRDIKGYEGLYQVSNLGRVRSLRNGEIKAKCLCKNGYYYCHLYKNNERKLKKVSRLVAEAFITNPYSLPCVNHKSEIKTDDRVENLEWCTYEYNSRYGSCSNRMIKTRNRNNTVNKEKPVLQYTLEGVLVNEFKSMCEAERQTGVLQQHISRVCRLVRKSAGGYVWKYKEVA